MKGFVINMATIFTMNQEELKKDFIKKFNYKKYTFCVISADIVSNGKHDNVWVMKRLLPPTKALVDMVSGNNKKSYKEKYLKYINLPESLVYIMMILQRLAIDDSNVVLICSKEEDELKYMNIIRKFFDETFDITVYKFKDYMKNPKKCDSVKDVKRIKKQMQYIYENVITRETIDAVSDDAIFNTKSKKKKKK